MTNLILRSKNLRLKSIGDAVFAAAANSKRSVAEKILESPDVNNGALIEHVFKEAVCKGDLEVVKWITDLWQIYPSTLSQAMMSTDDSRMISLLLEVEERQK